MPVNTAVRRTAVRWPAWVVIVAACSFSAGPLLIHLSTGGINPFYFSAVVLASTCAVLALFLGWAKKFFDARHPSSTPRIGSTAHLSYFDRGRGIGHSYCAIHLSLLD